jgi:hypothetical protein
LCPEPTSHCGGDFRKVDNPCPRNVKSGYARGIGLELRDVIFA